VYIKIDIGKKPVEHNKNYLLLVTQTSFDPTMGSSSGNVFNVRNSTHLITDLKEIPIDSDLRFASFDIADMYSNIPTKDLINIIEQSRDQHELQHNIRTEILNLSNTLIQQNYFQYQDLTYIQKEGLAMGAPSSSLLSEIYLQHIEMNKIVHILLKYHIVGYVRYVDDILIAYKQNLTNIHEVLACFNKLTPTLKFTIEKETENKINFLDISITRNDDSLSFSIYRKPTTTDTIIPNDSCHPPEHKMAAIKFLNQSTRHIQPQRHQQNTRKQHHTPNTTQQ
jgi:hypothetical protein